MTQTENALQVFLSDNGICCDTCRFYAKNSPIPDKVRTICTHAMNKQTTVYDAQYFTPRNDSFMCEFWMDTDEAIAQQPAA